MCVHVVRFIYSFDWLTFLKENRDTEWAFSRTRMWLKYLDNRGTALPPPLNILGLLCALFTSCCCCCCKFARKVIKVQLYCKQPCLPPRSFSLLILWMETFWHLYTLFQSRGQNTENNELTKNEYKRKVCIFSSNAHFLCCAVHCTVCCSVLCCAVLCCAVHCTVCCSVLCCAVLCCPLYCTLCYAVLCCAVLCWAVCCAVLCCAVLCCAEQCAVLCLLYCTVLFCAVLCCAVLSSVLCWAVCCAEQCAVLSSVLCCACCTVLCCAVLCCAVLCCAVLCWAVCCACCTVFLWCALLCCDALRLHCIALAQRF